MTKNEFVEYLQSLKQHGYITTYRIEGNEVFITPIQPAEYIKLDVIIKDRNEP